jgi:alpha-L-fucosidase
MNAMRLPVFTLFILAFLIVFQGKSSAQKYPLNSKKKALVSALSQQKRSIKNNPQEKTESSIIALQQSQKTEPNWESLKSRPYPQWFRDAKLGIFIHWSISSVPSWSGKEQYAEWFLRGILTGDSGRLQFQDKTFGKNWKYEDYAPLMKGELFNANQWADLFKRAGACYVVLVAKHHDGYCLWPSKYAKGWNTVDVGPKRDIVGELTNAVKASGLRMGLYYSLPEWNNPLYRWGFDKPEKVTRYVEEHMIPQFKELISTYKPSLIFSDGEWDHPASTWHSVELISWYYNNVAPDGIVNDRWGGGSEGGFRTPEYSSGLTNSDRPWAEVRGLGRSFGLNRNEPIEDYMTPEDLIHFFVKAVANGGGIILNVGPYADGQIPLLQQERLLQLGEWLKVNGEAIYGSTANKLTTEEKDVELRRIDPSVNFDWVRNSPGKPISEDDFTGEWAGFIQPKFSEDYLFEGNADDGMRVWINNQLVIDKWVNDGGQSESNVMEQKKGIAKTSVLKLEANKKYAIRISYQELKQNASIFFWWSSKNQPKEIVSQQSLFTDKNRIDGNGLNVVYRSKATRLCYTRNHGNLYAISLDWPDNMLVLNVEKPTPGTIVTLLGRKGTLPWKYANGKMIINTRGIKFSEIPCQWAWTFKISNSQ